MGQASWTTVISKAAPPHTSLTFTEEYRVALNCDAIAALLSLIDANFLRLLGTNNGGKCDYADSEEINFRKLSECFCVSK